MLRDLVKYNTAPIFMSLLLENSNRIAWFWAKINTCTIRRIDILVLNDKNSFWMELQQGIIIKVASLQCYSCQFPTELCSSHLGKLGINSKRKGQGRVAEREMIRRHFVGAGGSPRTSAANQVSFKRRFK